MRGKRHCFCVIVLLGVKNAPNERQFNVQIATGGRVSPFVSNNKNALRKRNGAIFPMMLPFSDGPF